MNTLQYLRTMESAAKAYRTRAVASINRNSHMNRLDGKCDLTQDQIDAVLVDFINHTAGRNGVDYGLYTKDLGLSMPEVPQGPVGSCSGHAAQQQKDIDTERSDFSAVESLAGQLIAAREVSDEEIIIGFFTDAMTNDLFKVTIQYIGNQANE